MALEPPPPPSLPKDFFVPQHWWNNPSRRWESDLLGDQYNNVVSHSSTGTDQCDMGPHRNLTKFTLTSSVEKSRRRSPCFLLLRSPAYRPNLKKLRLSDTKEGLDRKHPTKEDWLSLLAHRKAAMLILHTDTQERRVLARAFISKGIGNEWFFSVLVPRIKEPRLLVFYRKSLKIFKWNHSKYPFLNFKFRVIAWSVERLTAEWEVARPITGSDQYSGS